MSDSTLLICFRNGEPASFKREVFETIFLAHFEHPKLYTQEPNNVWVQFPDGSGSEIYLQTIPTVRHNEILCGQCSIELGADADLDDENDIQCMSFLRCAGEAMFSAIYELADRTCSVINWPALKPATVVTNAATFKELPPDFFGIETVRIVYNGADLQRSVSE